MRSSVGLRGGRRIKGGTVHGTTDDYDLDIGNPRKVPIVGEKPSSLAADGDGELEGVGSAEAVFGAELSGGVGDGEVGRGPLQVGKQGEQAVVLIHQWLVPQPVGVHEQFGHRDGGSDGSVLRPFEPREDFARQIGVGRIRLQMINEDTGIETDPAVPFQKGLEGSYSQLARSRAR